MLAVWHNQCWYRAWETGCLTMTRLREGHFLKTALMEPDPWINPFFHAKLGRDLGRDFPGERYSSLLVLVESALGNPTTDAAGCFVYNLRKSISGHDTSFPRFNAYSRSIVVSHNSARHEPTKSCSFGDRLRVLQVLWVGNIGSDLRGECGPTFDQLVYMKFHA